MEVPNVVSHQFEFLLPIGVVIICAALVFAFGFKPSVEPPSFKLLGFSTDDKKSPKKKKLKDKKSQSNGHATAVSDDIDHKRSEQLKAKQSTKNDSNKSKKSDEKITTKKQDQQKSPSNQTTKKQTEKKGKENVEVKGKSAKKKEEKPSDYDDGEWETAFSRKDKKNRKKEDEAPVKANEKKSNKKKQQENVAPSPKGNTPKTSEKKGKSDGVLTPSKKENEKGKKSAIHENKPVNKEFPSGDKGKKQQTKKSPAPAPVKQSEPLKDKKNIQESVKNNGEVGGEKKSKKKARKD